MLKGDPNVELKDPLPDRQLWIAKNFSKTQIKSQAKTEAKLAKAALKAHQSGGTQNN